MAELKITKNNFESEVLRSEVPVLLDFWATWCPPCRMLSPIIEEIAGEYEGRAKVGKVNVDEEPELAAMFKVENIPTMVVMKEGKVRTETNRSGGIQGGISNGEDIYFRVAFKPVATITKRQDTITQEGEEVELEAHGRHDPCVVPRAVPVVEAMTAIVVLDMLLESRV